MFFDWRQFHLSNTTTPAVIDPRRRLRICLVSFTAMLLLVFARIVQLEVTQGAGFRAEALRPIERETVLPAARGRILARDGTVLACDSTVQAVAVEYRWLQDPPDQRWLRNVARSRLPKTARKNAGRVAAEQANVLADRARLSLRLSKLCGLSPEQWAAKTRKIQARVERISETVNHRQETAVEPEKDGDSWAVRMRRLLLEDPPPPRIVVKEELQAQVVVEDVAPAVAAEINAHGDRYPGTKIVELAERTYPQGALAAHALGHLGPGERDELVGRMGVERQYDALLQGHPGVAVEQIDRSGRVVTSYRREEPAAGRDVQLTLDVALQRTAEDLLQSALDRRAIKRGQDYLSGETNSSDPFLSGGAVVVMDVRSGAILAAASAPTFDPNVFARGDSEELTALLSDQSKPLFDRTSRMAIPPGSTFKTLTAVALLETATVKPQTPFSCRGYLHDPDRQRCELYIRQGVGHGNVTLADALAESCNVYFFHFAGLMGPRPLVDWAERFGFGRPTGIDLPGEAAGTLPCPESPGGRRSFPLGVEQNGKHLPETTSVPARWRNYDTQSMAVGQSSLRVTPLQMLRMMAAVGNGGWLVTPHVSRVRACTHAAADGKPTVTDADGNDRVRASTHPATLDAIREGLRRVVADPKGTAHATVYMESTAIAGKTGTAETGEGRASHAWFVGYAPAEAPKVAFVVVLEHAGAAATNAGPVVKRLVRRMEELGIL